MFLVVARLLELLASILNHFEILNVLILKHITLYYVSYIILDYFLSCNIILSCHVLYIAITTFSRNRLVNTKYPIGYHKVCQPSLYIERNWFISSYFETHDFLEMFHKY